MFPGALWKIYTFLKDIDNLVEILLFTTVCQSEYIIPVLIKPKGEGNVKFMTEYWNLDQQLVHNPYLMTNTCKNMH